MPISLAGIKDRYEKMWLNTLHVMSNVKVFAMQDGWLAGRLAGWMNMTHYIDPYDTHMDKKKR